MAFFEDRFPTCISFNAAGGPLWSTSLSTTNAGFRNANRNFQYPLHQYEAAQGVRTEEDFESVRAFFYNVFGQYDGFRYKDWSDYKVASGQGVILTVAGGGKQLGRRYSFGSRNFDRPISKPVSGTVTISGGGTLDYTSGLITGGTPTAWVGQFDVPVAFTSDLLQAEIVNKRGDDQFFLSWQSIGLREIRL